MTTPELQVLLSRRLRLSEGSGKRRNVTGPVRGIAATSNSSNGLRGATGTSISYTAPRGPVHKLVEGERTVTPPRRSPILQRRDPPGSPVGSTDVGLMRQSNGDGRSTASSAACPPSTHSNTRGNPHPPLPPGDASQASRHNGPAWVENLLAKRRADCAAVQVEDKAGALLKDLEGKLHNRISQLERLAETREADHRSILEELRGKLVVESEKAQDLSARLRRQHRCREMDAAVAEQRCKSLREEYSAWNENLLESRTKYMEECAELQVRSHALAEKCTENEAVNKNLSEEYTHQRLRRRVLEEECRGLEETEQQYIEECAQLALRNCELEGKCTEYQALNNALQESQARVIQECEVHQIESHSLLEEFRQQQECDEQRRHRQSPTSLEVSGSHREQGQPAATVANRSPASPALSAVTLPPDAGVQDHWMSSECRLRNVMVSSNAPTEDLRQAILSVDALLSEAKRELAARELRERRAAYEQLHEAREGRQEEALEVAISVARKVGIDEEDIARAEERLEQLRSLSVDDRATQEARINLLDRKRRAFQMVKQGKDHFLFQLLSETVSSDRREGSQTASKQCDWMQWKDYAGRTLLTYAKELRAVRVQDCLERFAKEQEAASWEPERSPEPNQSGVYPCKARTDLIETHALDATGDSFGVSTPNVAPWRASIPQEPLISTSTPRESWPVQTGAMNEKLKIKVAVRAETPPPAETKAAICASSDDASALQFPAFRAVVRDDTEKLGEILQSVPQHVWSSWQNKAGKDLLTLAQERGSSGSQSMVAKALGLVQERKRESFEERETVWVLFPGEVQARHATVLEDVPETAGDVLLELWDSDDPPTRVNRGIVLKAE